MSCFRTLSLLAFVALLSGCKAVVLDPSGDVAVQERDLLIVSTILMLVIILPVMVLTGWFAWKYRQSNTAARYEPDWDHSTKLELVIWAGPLLIVVCLGALTWVGTHLLDPFRPIGRLAPGQMIARDVKPLEVDVVGLDWKWLFIYPEYGIATINELAAPVNRPIEFRITSSTVMNSFYIPALAGQIFAMPGMEMQLHAVINHPGTFKGFSANYSGSGFSGMRFAFLGLSDAEFGKWIAEAKAKKADLNRANYRELQRPSENEPVRKYGAVDPGLYKAILNLCVEPGQMCMNEMSAIDAKGGLGVAGVYNLVPLEYDGHQLPGAVFGPNKSYVASVCSTDKNAKPESNNWGVVPRESTPIVGAGLALPFSSSVSSSD